ncbi:type VII secretion system-associated protein [Nocardia asiatica]|uniref:type VII secretion system-associated protein n=1 Tax=Nocardia asiatica TaxID=209252 RepID=UPI003EE260AD
MNEPPPDAVRLDDWFVLLDPTFDVSTTVELPADAIVGGWPVLDEGAVGPFEPNPHYRPRDEAAPTDPINATLRLLVSADDVADDLVRMVRGSVVALGCDEENRPAIGKSPDGELCVVVATAESQKRNVPTPRWWPIAGDRLPDVIPEGVDILLNPASSAPFRLRTDHCAGERTASRSFAIAAGLPCPALCGICGPVSGIGKARPRLDFDAETRTHILGITSRDCAVCRMDVEIHTRSMNEFGGCPTGAARTRATRQHDQLAGRILLDGTLEIPICGHQIPVGRPVHTDGPPAEESGTDLDLERIRTGMSMSVYGVPENVAAIEPGRRDGAMCPLVRAVSIQCHPAVGHVAFAERDARPCLISTDITPLTRESHSDDAPLSIAQRNAEYISGPESHQLAVRRGTDQG